MHDDSSHDDPNHLNDAALREEQHAIALRLQELARRARRALLIALASDTHSQDAMDELQVADEVLTEIAELATQNRFIALPELDDVRRGVDRLACQLYQDGACDGLGEVEHEAFLDRHARALTALDGIGPVTARRLFAHGISDLDQLRELGSEALDDVTGLNAATLARIRASIAEEEQAIDAK
ncbi:MAG: helix-hairpin-helix domain-containing protein [Halomonas sp.]|uniref:helix-hairpin-helix domain-containing protein n=1 Tax=Halomonas sp. TaxID=1486246 RepID=UPI001A018E72|nr:helix-hairpin-helix domain-containing protein [Halomonas sp.]MBE0487935.1 helix-hairpin-helix domain-containing protein [Halomonas sp.]